MEVSHNCLNGMFNIFYSVGCHGFDRMVVGFTTTYAINAYQVESYSWWEVYSIHHYVIKFVSDSGFLLVLWFPPPIKLTATI
jgi:hypothetical protein